jgi:hypothetical protein
VLNPQFRKSIVRILTSPRIKSTFPGATDPPFNCFDGTTFRVRAFFMLVIRADIQELARVDSLDHIVPLLFEQPTL